MKPSDYTKYESFMVSEQVREDYVKTLRDDQDWYLKFLMSLLKGIPFLGIAVGKSFEHYANRKLSEREEFLVRSLDDGLEGK
jgi:hypothetical protein